MIRARKSPRTGQVFQSGIGGSVSSGTFEGLGRSWSSALGGQRRVELSARRRGDADQLGLVHLDALELAGGRLDPERRRFLEDRRGEQPDLVIPLGRLGQRPLEDVPGAGDLIERQLARAQSVRSTWTVTVPLGGASAGLGKRTRSWIG